jgi:alkylation response protein AidB-like acyl-CoA dehydrogenase
MDSLMLPSELKPDHQDLLAHLATLAREKFLPRADRYDRTATFPAEDFADLFRAGLHAAAVPREHGGLGLGPYREDVFTLWMITKELAKADLSLARCWEAHVNSLILLDGLGTEDQKARWFRGVVERGEKWAAWSGEPQTQKPGETERFGTRLTRVDGGYVVSGSKVFSTSAGGADWAILLVNEAGPGGARHGSADPDSLLLLACDLTNPTVEFDGSWWDPIGMRATVSHLARFHDTFVPQECVVGPSGAYLHGGWQTCFTPHYAASFLGAAECAYEYALELVGAQSRRGDPYVQHHVGCMTVDIDTAYLWLRRVATLWESRRYDEARDAGSRARYLIEELAQRVFARAIKTCGARSLNRPSRLERAFRDLSIYVRHDNADHILATIGRSVLGLAHDDAFFKP